MRVADAAGAWTRLWTAGPALAIVAVSLCGNAFGAPHLEPCQRIDGYEQRVEQLMRRAWPEHLQLLTIMYVPLTERGIGLARTERGFDLVRLELDESFWNQYWSDVGPSGDHDVANAAAIATEVYRPDGVGVARMSVPIGEELGLALLAVFERVAATAKVEAPTNVIVVDGHSFEILLSQHACVELRSPPPDSAAGRIDAFVRFLDGKVPAWRPWEREAFEADVLRAIPN